MDLAFSSENSGGHIGADETRQRILAEAALEAHARACVPCLEIALPGISPRNLGGLFFFFMFACYISACLLGVNPFTQDGVEDYKKNMYRLLGKKVQA